MNFSDVLNDIKKLKGLELKSIRPGANIVITDIDSEHGNLMICSATGQVHSRPISQLKKIWDRMVVEPAVHVDGVLHGSGSCRNQPETILANLPYVEWLKIDNKKHIAYVNNQSHAYGTLKEMDSIRAVELIKKINSNPSSPDYCVAIASCNVDESIFILDDMCPGVTTPIAEGIYRFETKSVRILFLSSVMYGLEEGTYCVLKASYDINSLKKITINNVEYFVINERGIKALVQKQ